MTNAEWAIAAATLIGPILAVQAQKWIERAREHEVRKTRVFGALMATRAARLSPDHVRALNAIDLTFLGRRFLRWPLQTERERGVVAAWREYFQHLNQPFRVQATPQEQGDWGARGDELFINLLLAMSVERRFPFDRVALKQGHYSPLAHGNLEMEERRIRQSLQEMLTGRGRLNVNVYAPDAPQVASAPTPNRAASPIAENKGTPSGA